MPGVIRYVRGPGAELPGNRVLSALLALFLTAAAP